MSTSQRIPLVMLAWVLFVWSFPAIAQTPPPLPEAIRIAGSRVSLSQSVTVRVSEISLVALSGDVRIPFVSAPAGSAPEPVVDASATYAITVNGTGKKLVGALDSDFPTGMSLQLVLDPPAGAQAFPQILSTSAVDLVTGLGLMSESGLSMTYTGTVGVTTPPSGPSGVSRQVTLTLVDN